MKFALMQCGLALLVFSLVGCGGDETASSPAGSTDAGTVLPECDPGYGLQGQDCVDVDECALKNGECGDPAHVICVNHEGEPPTCEDIDECLEDNGSCGDPVYATCVNQESAPHLCEDIDECLEDNGGCGDPTYWACVNLEAQPASCEDIDECDEGDEICGDPERWDCVNVEGADPECIHDWGQDWGELTAGVELLQLGGSIPSSLISYSSGAFPVIMSENRACVVAARVGAGRALHVGHESLIGGKLLGEDDTPQLIRNALYWLSSSDDPKIGLLENLNAMKTFLDGEDLAYTEIGFGELSAYDMVVITTGVEWSEGERAALQDYLANGGGVLSGGHAWYWSYYNTNAAENHPGNKLLADVGFVISGATAPSGDYVVGDVPPSNLQHASSALTAVLSHMDGSAPLSLEDQVVGADTVGHAVGQLPLSFDSYWDGVLTFLELAPPVVPTSEDPLVTAEAPLDRLVVEIESKLAMEQAPAELTAHPAAADFPGQPLEGAQALSKTMTINGSYEGRSSYYAYSNPNAPVWRSTGLYLVAGTVATVTVPEHATDDGLSVLVGSHTDTLWKLESIERFPRITRSFPIETAETEIGSRFGGLIYVRVPGGVDVGEIEVTLDGAIAAPRYIHGVTTLEQWQTIERNHPAPFAEIGSGKFVMSMQSAQIRELDDPSTIMDFWDTVLDYDADLEGTPHDRVREERFAFDRQISAGWMHSGYPLMAYVSATTELLDVAAIQENGAWGPFHELGHNHQYKPWILPGTTETTCNLWSVYISEELLGLDLGVSHDALSTQSRADRTQAYIDGGKDFYGSWSVWTALETHLQLKETFGWEIWTDTFTFYRTLAAQDTPSETQDKIDWFAVHTSTAANKDLTNFYLAWGFPLSDWVLTMNSALEPWDDHPMVGL
jgi:hypothetical protein